MGGGWRGHDLPGGCHVRRRNGTGCDVGAGVGWTGERERNVNGLGNALSVTVVEHGRLQGGVRRDMRENGQFVRE